MKNDPRNSANESPETRRKPERECLKCGSKGYTGGEVRMTGGRWTKFFDVQSERFVTKSCRRCGFTEFYKADSSATGDVIDFIFGN